LPHGQKSGLRDAVEVLKGGKDIAFVYFGDADVVRSRLVRDIVAAYEKRDAAHPNKYGKDTP
jgi:phosphate starvation-inducible PhoH-like protein